MTKRQDIYTHDAVDMRKLKSIAVTLRYLYAIFMYAATFIFMPCTLYILIVIASYLKNSNDVKRCPFFSFLMCKRFAVVEFISSLHCCYALPFILSAPEQFVGFCCIEMSFIRLIIVFFSPFK